MIATQSKQAEQRRLAWRCRRGLLELDIVLQRFVANYFYDLNAQELAVFDGLLALPDNDFWDLLQQNNVQKKLASDAALQSVLAKLTAHKTA